MRRFTASLLALALLPTVALAAPEGASADKRMLIFRTAIGRDNCPQAREVAESMSKDFPEDGNVKLMLAQVLACEGKWAEAFVPMMAAKTAGVDVTAEEAKILAQVALVDVTVTVDGKESDGTLPVVAQAGDAVWKGVPTAGGRVVFATPSTPTGFRTADGMPFTGSVEARDYAAQTRTSVALDLKRRPSVPLQRPPGLDRAITLRANGLLLGPDPRDVTIDPNELRPLHYEAQWASQGLPPIVTTWTATPTDAALPWVHTVRMQDGDLLDAGIHPPGEAASVAKAAGGVQIIGTLKPQDGRVVEVAVTPTMLQQGRARTLKRRLFWGGPLAATGLAMTGMSTVYYHRGAEYASLARTHDFWEEWDDYTGDVDTALQQRRCANGFLLLGMVVTLSSAAPWLLIPGSTIDIGGAE